MGTGPAVSEGADLVLTELQSGSHRFNNYAWPGNVRELRNTLERAVIVCDTGMVETKHFVLTIPERVVSCYGRRQ